MGSRYRCRVSPSGVPGCTPGTGGTGGTAGDDSDVVIEGSESTPIVIAADTTEVVAQESIELFAAGKIAVVHSCNQTMEGVESGGRVSYTFTIDGAAAGEQPQNADGEGDNTIPVANTIVFEGLAAGVHVVTVEAEFLSAEGTVTIEASRLTLIGASPG